MNDVKSYLFDFDGTLVDSMETWAGVHMQALRDGGIPVPDDFVNTITPLGNYRASIYTLSLGLSTPLEQYLETVRDTLFAAYSTRIEAKPGVVETLLRLRQEGARLQVFTASPHLYVDVCLQRLGLWDLFENVWSIDDFGMTKGQVEIYQAAAERLGLPVSACAMVDDNYTAIATAKAAGMRTIAVYDTLSASSEPALRETADVYLTRYDEWK